MKPHELFEMIKEGRLSEVEKEVSQEPDAARDDSETYLEAAALVDDPSRRYRSIQRLVELGIDVPWASRGCSGVLNILFGAAENDVEGLTRTVQLLLDHGADAGIVSQQGRTPTLELLVSRFTDSELAPLYDRWFTQDDLALRHRNRAGLDALTTAEKLGRTDAATRINHWLTTHPE